ncbi:MICOS complex subunit MIC13 homolog QIL1 [Scaptodrosophila lebanonensis]|uniref:MICOS complex subunit MIC13 n=1 Tax=Drosophila lebanonensis TaxID=7225 RepID=A0A6J2U0D3_DROLE|nr:MICOS complex subunit MIC13 homolog QIL1 [Scaptodrosophila lebanonensis]
MVFGILIRGGLVVGAVYYTRSAGVWGNTEQTEKIYNGVKTQLSPYFVKVTNQLPFDIPPLPKAGEIRFLAKHYYNVGVKGTFRFVHMLPCYAGRGIKKVKDTFEEFSKSPTSTGSGIGDSTTKQ